MQKLSVFYEDSSFVVIYKEAGWYSVPAREPKTSDIVASHLVCNQFGEDSRVIHRLDRFTSGIMLFAKNYEAQKLATEWFEKKIVKKTYLFLASPTPSKPALQIKTLVADKPAQTLFEVIEEKKRSEENGQMVFLGRATPLTGRFHQIREHAREARFPIVGDKKYGSKINFERVCLHAESLTLPFGKFESPLADDIKSFFE